MWIFGYASLIWKVDFPYYEKIHGHIRGFTRRFWQGSTDHRGIPGKPGRVATLVATGNEHDHVYGVAYKICDAGLTHLDWREKGGYRKHHATFYPDDPSHETFDLKIYIGTEDNPNYLGPAALAEIARTICHSEGPSGKNIDYLLELAKAVREHFPEVRDEHLFELETEVLKHSHECDSISSDRRVEQHECGQWFVQCSLTYLLQPLIPRHDGYKAKCRQST